MTLKAFSSLNKKITGHAFFLSLSDGLGTAVLALFAMLMLIPVSTAAIPDLSIFNVEYTHHQMKYRFYFESLTGLINGASLAAGMAAALALFRYMLTKRSSDFYFSLGIKRTKLFAVRSLAGGILLFFVIAIPMTLSLILNLTAFGELGYFKETLTGFAFMLSGLYTLALLGFGAGALICSMVGTALEAALFTPVVLFSPTILFFGINGLMRQLLFGSPFGLTARVGTKAIEEGLVAGLAAFNPVLFFYDYAVDYCAQYVRLDGYKPLEVNPVLIAAWLGAAAAIFFAGAFAITKRKAEIAGVSGEGRLLNGLSSLILPFGVFAAVLDFSYEAGKALAFASSVLAYAVVYFILAYLQKAGGKSLGEGLFMLPAGLGVVLALSGILASGGLGYKNRIPKPDSLVSAQLSYVGSPNYLTGDIRGVSSGQGYYVSALYDFDSAEDLTMVAALHKEILAGGKGKLQYNSEDFSQTTVPYDLIVRYRLKSGREMVRYYDRTTYEVLEKLLALDETKRVKESTVNMLEGGQSGSYWASGAYRQGEVYMSDSWYANPSRVIFTQEQRKELLSCLARDYEAQSLMDRYFPDTPPLGVILFAPEGSNESLSFGYSLENALVFVTPAFTRTLSYLEQTGLDACFGFKSDYESMTFQRYNPYIGINRNLQPKSPYFIGYKASDAYSYIQTKDFGANLVVDDPTKLEELAPLLKNAYFMSDGGYLVCVRLKNSTGYVYKFLADKDVPEDLRPKLN